MPLTQFNPSSGPNIIAGTAATKLLSGSNMDDMTVMLRETVQNSWDARNKSDKIFYQFKAIELSELELKALRNEIGQHEYGNLILNRIYDGTKTAIQVLDKGTTGLSGEITYEYNHDRHSKFLKFVFEVGNANQGAGAGGSFGYGKASLYKLSKVGTVAIYSRVRIDSGYEDRFIIKSINRISDYEDNSAGVFWWGSKIHTPENESLARSILPVTGQNAKNIANSIGMNTFAGTDTGTVLLIYEPFLEQYEIEHDERHSNGFPIAEVSITDKLRELVTDMQRTSVHYFWAKYQNNGIGIEFCFSVRNKFGDETINENINPYKISPYNYFLTCLERARDISSSNDTASDQQIVIKSLRPEMELGILSWMEFSERDINPYFGKFFKNRRSAIALMRNVEFVVDYMNVDVKITDENTGQPKMLLGVFRTFDGRKVPRYRGDLEMIPIEEIYRAAENQTHGQWSSHNLDNSLGPWSKIYINQTIKKIESTISTYYPEIEENYQYANNNINIDDMIFLGQFISMTQGSGRPNTTEPNGPAGDNRSVKTKAKIEFIKTIKSVKNEDEVVEAVHMFKITNKNINKSIRVFPVCPDEYGNMTIKETKNSKLPVSIELDFIHGDTSGIEAKQGNNGSFIITAPIEQYDINIKVKAITDCRYAIDIKS